MTTKSSTYVYDDFLLFADREERGGQREAVRLLCELSDSPSAEQYALAAPTGTGKSYAALLAGVHNAKQGRRTVIGTSTIVLSEQYEQDMKVVSGAFPEVKFCLLKGAANYFCGNKVAQELKACKTKEMKDKKIAALAAFKRGRVSSLPVWATADPDFCSTCMGKLKDAGTSTCEYSLARSQALLADVVVTTHAMIMVDLARRERGVSSERSDSTILGRIWLTIFDEAHKAAESLTVDSSFGGFALRSLDFNGLLGEMPYDSRRKFVEHFDKLAADAWTEEQKWLSPSPQLANERLRIWPTEQQISRMFRRIDTEVSDREKFKMIGHVSFLKRSREVLTRILDGEADGSTGLWVRGGSYRLREMTPSQEVVDNLLNSRVAWMSATIGTDSRPKYSLDKCGIGSFAKLYELESPFDYSKQLQWTVRTESQAGGQDTTLLTAIHNHWEGGMVVLTPFHRRKDRITQSLTVALQDEIVQAQAQGGGTAAANASVMENHCSSADMGKKPVLVGVEIFSTGVDLPGDRLKKLVVAGLFPIRDDLAYQTWRDRWLSSFGGDGYTGYELPERAIVLEQQIGRVIRRVDDTGVVVLFVEDRDWTPGSRGRGVIEEALKRFPGVVAI